MGELNMKDEMGVNLFAPINETKTEAQDSLVQNNNANRIIIPKMDAAKKRELQNTQKDESNNEGNQVKFVRNEIRY